MCSIFDLWWNVLKKDVSKAVVSQDQLSVQFFNYWFMTNRKYVLLFKTFEHLLFFRTKIFHWNHGTLTKHLAIYPLFLIANSFFCSNIEIPNGNYWIFKYTKRNCYYLIEVSSQKQSCFLRMIKRVCKTWSIYSLLYNQKKVPFSI